MARIGTSLLAAAALWLLCVFFCVFFRVVCAFFRASFCFRFTPVVLSFKHILWVTIPTSHLKEQKNPTRVSDAQLFKILKYK